VGCIQRDETKKAINCLPQEKSMQKKIAFTEQAIELRGLFFLGQKGKINNSGKSHHTSSKQDRL
jgi:hypothetical protein